MTEQNQAMINARPRLRIADEVRSDMNGAVLDLQVRLPLSGMASAEVRVVNWSGNSDDGAADFPFMDVSLGQRLEVLAGDSDEAPIFDGEITALEERHGQGAPQLVILAEDKLHRLTRIRHNRAFEDQPLSDVINSVAQEAGLSADVSIGNASSTWHQLNESNLAFLMRLIAPYDIALRLIDGELRVRAEEADSEPVVVHTQDNLRQLRIIADLNQQPTEIAVQGYNTAADDAVSANASSLTPAPQGQTAADLLADLSWDGAAIVAQPFAPTQAEGEAWAKGGFHHRAKRFLHGDLLCSGLPQLRSGREVEVGGVSERVRGVYQIVDCTHCFNNSDGYTTRIKVQRADWNN